MVIVGYAVTLLAALLAIGYALLWVVALWYFKLWKRVCDAHRIQAYWNWCDTHRRKGIHADRIK